MFPGALSQMEGPIFLRFLPPRHSIGQHFTVLQIRDVDINIKRAAVVEQEGDVIAGLPSLQVSQFGTRFCKFTFYQPNWQAAIRILLIASIDKLGIET